MQKIIFGNNFLRGRQEMDQQINRCESIDGSTHRLSRDYSILQQCRQSTTSTINSNFLPVVAVHGEDKIDDLIPPQELHRASTIVAVDQSTRLLRSLSPISIRSLYIVVCGYIHVRVYVCTMCVIESERERNEGNWRDSSVWV